MHYWGPDKAPQNGPFYFGLDLLRDMYHYVPIVLSSSFLEAVFHQFLFLDCDRIVTQVELGVRSLNGQNACIGACHVGNH